jgi:isopenicillin N synthase-like dioxygenase
VKARFSVPLVDISAYVGDGSSDARHVAATQLDHACRTVGFVQIAGHGIADETVAGLTSAWADRVPGLRVLGPDGVWHDVQPAEGALLVNLGDLTGRWTNDRWLSTLHRVKPPIADGVIQRRRSAAYFHDGNIDALISTIPTCVGPDGSHYPPITIGEHLSVKLASSRAGKPNTTAGPETERARLAKG